MTCIISHDEDIRTYHANTAISWSKLHYFMQNYPIDYKRKYIDKIIEEERKEAYDIGHATETLLQFGDDAYQDAVQVFEHASWRGKQAALDRELAYKDGKIPLLQDDADMVLEMVEAVQRNKAAMAIIDASTPQVTFRCNVGKMQLQCRCDWYDHEKHVDCDIKTFDASRDFAKQSFDFGYHMARSFYRWVIRRTMAQDKGVSEDLIQFPASKMIAVSKERFPRCTVWTLENDLLEYADKQLLGDGVEQGPLQKLIACYTSNHWPDAPEEETLRKPHWAK